MKFSERIYYIYEIMEKIGLFFWCNLTTLNTEEQKKVALEVIKQIKPFFNILIIVLYVVLSCVIIYKIIFLAINLVRTSDEPEKRAEIQKAFFYSLLAPIIALVANSIVHILAERLFFSS